MDTCKIVGICWVLMLTLSGLNAQKTSSGEYARTHYLSDFQKTASDTIDSHFVQATPVLYLSPNGGFVSGNTGFGEKARLQEFYVKGFKYTLHGFLYWFGYKQMGSLPTDSSRLIFSFVDMDTAGTVYDSNRVIPKSVWQSDTVFVSQIDTSSQWGTALYFWPVAPREVSRNYTAGIRFDLLHSSDTLALWSSSDGDPPRKAQSWEFWLDKWRPMYYTWGLDLDLGIFPVVDLSTGIQDDFFKNIRIGPSPTNDFLSIQAAIPGNPTEVLLLSASGAMVKRFPLDAFAEEHRLSLHAFPAGHYYLIFGGGELPLPAVKICLIP